MQPEVPEEELEKMTVSAEVGSSSKHWSGRVEKVMLSHAPSSLPQTALTRTL